MRAPIFSLRNLKVISGGEKILDIPELEIFQGEIFTIIGPNGAGKSTLLRTIGLLEDSSQGEIFFGGERIGPSTDKLILRRQMAMVFQEPLLYDTTVRENVATGLKLRKRPKAEIEEKVSFWLKKLNIEHLANRLSIKLSSGEAQRVSLARALILQPKVFLLDEPFTKLDPSTKERLIDELREILKENNTTTVFVTNDRTEALSLSDRIAVLEKGKILQLGFPEDIFEEPCDEKVASLVGIETILYGTVVSERKGLVGIEVKGQIVETVSDKLEVGDRVLLCIRPENVTLLVTLSPQEGSSARNKFKGRIVKISSSGPFYRITLDCGFPLIAYVTGQSMAELGLSLGREVIATFKATAVHIIKK